MCWFVDEVCLFAQIPTKFMILVSFVKVNVLYFIIIMGSLLRKRTMFGVDSHFSTNILSSRLQKSIISNRLNRVHSSSFEFNYNVL